LALVDLSAFRSALVDLTYQIDELEALKYGHYRTALDLSQETSERILDYSALVVRAEIEVFEKVAQKGWDASGAGLDDLIARAADPFASHYGCGNGGDGDIFSILPSESILPSPHGALSRANSISAAGGGSASEGKYLSLSAALSQNGDYEEYDDEDENSIFSGGFSSNPHPGPSTKGNSTTLPVFSPPPSSAGWGNLDNSDAPPSTAAHSTVGEQSDGGRTPIEANEGAEERVDEARESSNEWQDSDGDGENRTVRNHAMD
jgi:hypothetical protein